jgi:hypothetical protein
MADLAGGRRCNLGPGGAPRKPSFVAPRRPRDHAARVSKPPDETLDPAYVLLRRELVRAQARLKRVERERDQARAAGERLRALLRAHGIEPPEDA